MSLSRTDGPTASPSSTEEAPLYVSREPVYPKAIDGTFRRLKWAIMAFCLAVYYVTPWLRWDRGPEMPDQAVLVDLANRRFFFFWIEIWPQEFYYIIGLLVMAGIGLFLFTSALGRVWCGYACPQTVWVDLYQHVERFVDGDRNAQIRLARAPWGPMKAAKRFSKWAIWLAIAVATGGAWVFYFADAPTLATDLVTGRADPIAYSTIGVLTATTFVLGGFMREQVCIYMCPWPRIQAAMLDDQSLTVTYRHWRGEPRGKHRKGAKGVAAPAQAFQPATGSAGDLGAGGEIGGVLGAIAAGAERASSEPVLGDCIDCNACVAVCPTGVDIRNGDQIGCITCALCIDACDEMMVKVGKPTGLIGYVTTRDSLREQKGEAPIAPWRRVIRWRTIVYFAVWALIGVTMVVMLFMRNTIDLTVAHDRNPQFVTLSDGSIRNGYEIRLLNKNHEPRSFRLSLEAPSGLQLRVEGGDPSSLLVEADKLRRLRVYLTAPAGWAPADAAEESVSVRFWIEDLLTRERESKGSSVLVPLAARVAPGP